MTTHRDQSFVASMMFTRSEREECYRAQFEILRDWCPNWTPRLLVSDLAHAAFNAASGLWPELRWLWCLFHLKKAVREKLVEKLSRPTSMEPEEWAIGRRAIYQSAMHVLGEREAKDGTRQIPASQEGFATSLARVRDIMIAYQQIDLVHYWDTYVIGSNGERVERWSMLNRVAYAREHRALDFTVTELGRVKLPNMVVNNVYCEALFRYLKVITFKRVGGLRLERALEGLTRFFLRTSVKLAIHGHVAIVVVGAARAHA